MLTKALASVLFCFFSLQTLAWQPPYEINRRLHNNTIPIINISVFPGNFFILKITSVQLILLAQTISPIKIILRSNNKLNKPEWINFLQVNSQLIITGTLPLYIKNSDSIWQYTILALTTTAMESIQLNIIINRATFTDIARQLLRIKIVNLNATSFFLDENRGYACLSRLIAMPTNLTGSLTSELKIRNVQFGEAAGRNMPPIYFSPPVPLPNSWMTRSTHLFLFTTSTTLALVEPTCEQLRTNFIERFKDSCAASLIFDWTDCLILASDSPVFIATKTYLQSTSKINFNLAKPIWQQKKNINSLRTTESFDNSLLPALIIVLLLVFIAIAIAIRHFYRTQFRAFQAERKYNQDVVVKDALARDRRNLLRQTSFVSRSEHPLKTEKTYPSLFSTDEQGIDNTIPTTNLKNQPNNTIDLLGPFGLRVLGAKRTSTTLGDYTSGRQYKLNPPPPYRTPINYLPPTIKY